MLFSMRRADLLALTGLTSVKFNNMVHRGQVPFYVAEGGKGGWTDYSVQEAIQLALVLKFAEHDCPLDLGSAFVRENYRLLKQRLPDGGTGRVGLYFGFAQEEFELVVASETVEDAVRSVMVGTISELSEAMELLEDVGGVESISGLLIVNATACVRRMVLRGKRAGKSAAARAVEVEWGLSWPE